MSSAGTDKRRRRVERRASPEMLEALRAGTLSLRRADTLLYLPLEEQHALLAAKANESHKYQLAARTIRRYLDEHQRVDLVELASQLRTALSPAERV